MIASEILNPRDEIAVKEIMSQTCDILQGRMLRLAGEGHTSSYRAFLGRAERLDLFGISPICGPVTDAVTRASQTLGVVASREMHSCDADTVADHYITSFGPLTRPLCDDDPILCAVWGQFAGINLVSKRLRGKHDLYGFFGRRIDIKKLVGLSAYDRCYSAGSVALRQTVHAPLPFEVQAAIGDTYYGDCWLNTSPDDILSGQYPAAEVSVSDYSVDMWEFAPLLRRTYDGTVADGGSLD